MASVEVFAPASRRLCNLGFVLYNGACMMAGCATSLLMSLLLQGDKQVNMVEDAINWNQL